EAARIQASLWHRLQSSEEAQHRQAVLVRKLQAKVLQYRTWCQELEKQVQAEGGSLPGQWEATEDHTVEKVLLQLEEEQQRCESLAGVNTLLREHLDKANEVNLALKEDLGKLTTDWMRAREELEMKENEWRDERELYENYLRGERNRLLSLWRQVVTFRRHFLEMKTATDRDLSELKAEQMRLFGSILESCSHLNSGIQLWESVTLGRPVLKGQAQQPAVQERSQKTLEIMCLEVKVDLEKKELQDRVMELSALLAQSQKQNEEKEKTMKTLNDTLEILEASRLEKEYEASLTKSANEENLSLQKLIKDITAVVIDDSDSMVSSVTCTDSSQHAESSTILSCLSSVDAEHTFVLVQEALARRRRATRVLKEELSARQDSISFLQQQQSQQEEKCRKLQQRLEQLEEECKTSNSHQQHLQSLVEALSSDCANLEKTREELQQQLEVTEQEASCLRQSNTELQLKEDSAQGEKWEQQQMVERARHDKELLLKDLSALEGKHALLQSELLVVRETLEQSHLQKDLLKHEKQELTVALGKAEQAVTELTGAQNKQSSEVADLRAATANMSAINEALALDKVQLNKLVLQLEQEKEVLSDKVDEMERARICDEEKLYLCERRNEELCAEKARLMQLLEKAEEQQEGLQVELKILAEEKAETQEKLSQACRQQESSCSGLEQLRQESSRQGQALAKVAKEKEVLVHEKAALEVRLAALERDRQGLSEQLAEARSAKESLESSLFEAQQRLSLLEISRSQLETQLHAVTQAKEVIQGEVKCLQCELEAERSLRRQEQENMAQQLLRTEEQYETTLSLRQTDCEAEVNKLLQDLAREREGHHSELQEILEQWEKEKAETEREHEMQLFDMKQEVATMQAQQEEERIRVENAKQEALLEQEREKDALLERLLQTQGELKGASQQLEQLRQEVEEQRENGQNVREKLQGELQESQSKIKAVEKRHKEEIKTIKEEMNILLQQRDALQKQVEELTSQLAASEESQQAIAQKAQQDLSEVQELSKQKVLEFCAFYFRLTLSLKEKELSLRTLEENNLAQHNEVSQLLSALHQAQQLHSDHRREIQELNNQRQSLQEAVQEKEAALATREKQLLQELEESRGDERRLRGSLCALEAQVSELRVRLCGTESRAEALAAECQQASSAHCEAQSQLDKLHLAVYHLICDSRDEGTWKCLLSSEQGHVWGPAVSQARDLPAELTVDRVAAALQDLHQHLKQTQQDLSDAKKKIQDLELELSEREAERDHFSAHNQELQKQLAQSQEERKKNSLQAALQEEATALKEEAMNLHQEVASLERKLETTEEQRKDVLHERDRLQALKEKLLWEIKLLQESVTASETQANTATEMSHSLEHELQTTLSVLKLKTEEVEMQWEKIQTLEKEAAEVKALQENLTQMTAVLLEREEETKLYQEQMGVLEKQKEMHKITLDQVIKDITEKNQKTESQREHIQELEKQQEKQRIAVSRMNKDLEKRDQEIRSQQEEIEELERQLELQRTAMIKVNKELEERHQEIGSQQEQIQGLERQLELQRTAVTKMSKELEEKDKEIKCQEGKIIILEQHGTSQVRNLLMDLDHMKGNLKEKNLELLSLTQQIQELEKERGQVKALHASLEHLRAVLQDRECECDSQRDQLRLFQQYKEQQEGDVQELHGKVEKLTLSLSQKDQQLESQQKQIQEAEEAMEMQLRTVHDQLEQTLETLKEKDKLIDTQKQQREKTEEQMNILHHDLEYTKAKLKEKDFMVESQKKLIETFQNQEQDSEQQKEILQHLQVALKEKEEEIVSLRKQCEACKEKEGKHEAEQKNLQAIKLTLKEREKKIQVLEEAISELQQQKEEAEMQTKAVLQRLEYEMSQILKENCLKFLRQTEQINMPQLCDESMEAALISCQKQVNLLEEVVRKRDEENETLMQKLQHQEEELKTLQNLQLRLTEKNEEIRHHREQEKRLEEALHARELETKAQGEQQLLEEEIRGLREDLLHVQQTLTKKDGEIKHQRDRVRDCSLQRQKELTQQLEDERKVNGEELERVIAILKQTESGEVKWKEKAQALTLALTKCEMANGTLRGEIAILQRMVSERDTDQFRLQVGAVMGHQSTKISMKADVISCLCAQQAIAEGEQLSWLSEKRLLSQRLEHLQRAVAKLQLEKTELKELNAELRRTLEQVEGERRRLKRSCRGRLLPDACGFSLSDQHKVSASRQEELHTCCSRVAELQSQVSFLQTQLAQERKYKQDYVECCTKTSQELSELHQELSYSLAAVVREPKAAVLEAETQKLDRSLNLNLALLSLDHRSPGRQPLHSTARSTS
ncbi:CP250 protein, partial [Zapornia atra]|nr:CP250 protein [Zapornia atra]